MKIFKLVLYAVIWVTLSGCASSVGGKPYFKNSTRNRLKLTDPMYLGKLNKDVPYGTLHVVQKKQDLHILFRESWIDFMQEYGVIDGPIVKLNPGTLLKIEDFIYYNAIDSDGYYARGEIFHPEKKSFIPFEYHLVEAGRVKTPNENPSWIMTHIFRSKKPATVKTILNKLPWEDREPAEERVIDKVNLY